MKKYTLIAAFLFLLLRGNAQWSSLSTFESQDDYVYTLINYNNDLYCAGLFDSTSFWTLPTVSTRRIGRWDGTTWYGLGNGVKSPGNYFGIYSTCIYNGELYCAGDIDSAGTVNISNNIARWDGTDWDSVGAGSVYIGSLQSMCVYNGELYVGGGYGLNKWDGTTWTNLMTTDNISCMCVYNGELYVAGVTTVNSMPAYKMARYDGTNWSTVGGGVRSWAGNANVAVIKAMAVYNGELYVGGDLDSAGAVAASNLARWNGSAWNSVGGGANARVAALLADAGVLYVAGSFWQVGSPSISSNRAAAWNGTSWTPMSGLGGGGGLAMRNGVLYGLGVMNVEKWTGALPTSVPGSAQSFTASLYPNPSNGIVQLELGEAINDAQVTVLNLAGEVVHNETITCGNNRHTLNFAHLAAGVYLVQVTGPGRSPSTHKLVIRE